MITDILKSDISWRTFKTNKWEIKGFGVKLKEIRANLKKFKK